MLAIKIDNKDLETSFLEFANKQKESLENLASEAIRYFIAQKNKQTVNYQKKDISNYLKPITRKYDENYCDDIALTHINDSAKYIHDTRRDTK
jgi:hypothetical protein